MLVRDIEHEIVPAAIDASIGLLPWSPLGGGWLTGKYKRDQTPTGATRLGEKETIADIKNLVNKSSLPADEDIGAEWQGFIDSVQRPATQHRIKQLMDMGLQQNPDVEKRLPVYTGKTGEASK